MTDIMIKTVLEVISFYVDNGDIQTAAFVILVFYETMPPKNNFEAFFSRIIVSYLQLLKSLNLTSHATEVIKYGPQLDQINKFYKVSKTFFWTQ